MTADRERVEIDSLAAWRDWLAVHHGQADSIWLVSWKKGDSRHVPYGDRRDEALCWGWIDSLPAKLDDARTMVLMSPRRRGSRWSAINKARVAVLEAEGRMAPPGRAAVAAAQADGSWTALDGLDTVPADLAAALAGAKAEAGWQALAPSLRRGLLEGLIDAKRPETRARRIAAIVARAKSG
ncbi:YdeI/OmpD-associated family protein [Glacieibacterium frigidum]|uniref:YdeI/OmpD-associated family protein n=1 Tax=Glacieibacterium frigidum TaxID=2593303 RepID=A0A552UF51_9SPHN|nr:YdeI/OmpD-associated family protein [Glacieibacterium frigidum]TRW16840.1 hypothetical protein FMM06_01125 [Glacieibacterium frigidum]